MTNLYTSHYCLPRIHVLTWLKLVDITGVAAFEAVPDAESATLHIAAVEVQYFLPAAELEHGSLQPLGCIDAWGPGIA